MALDWRAELRMLQAQLRTLDTQRDQYFSAVVLVDGDVSRLPLDCGPRVFAGGQRVALVIPVQSPDGGTHLHYVFDDNYDESDHALLKELQRCLGRSQKILAAMPQRVVPRIQIPPQPNGLTENFLTWLYLLHWLGHQQTQSIFQTHLEFADTTTDMLSGKRLSPWDECSTIPDFDPIGLLTRTAAATEGLAAWKDRHQSAGKRLPQVIASSLSKPLLYASINAVDLVLKSDVAKTDETRASRRPKPGRQSQRADLLLDLLYRHHKQEDGSVVSDPLDQDKAARLLDVAQPTVSRMFNDLFADETHCKGQRAMDCYRHLCEAELIDPILTRLHLKRKESKTIREILTDKLDLHKAGEREEKWDEE